MLPSWTFTTSTLGNRFVSDSGSASATSPSGSTAAVVDSGVSSAVVVWGAYRLGYRHGRRDAFLDDPTGQVIDFDSHRRRLDQPED